MCNLYRLSHSMDEVALFFQALGLEPAGAAANMPEQVYPGYPALVCDGAVLRAMVWGFPLPRTGAKGQALKPKPVNNARSDKLSGPFWSASFRARRCLIPVSAYAEAQGPPGAMTRTWLGAPDGGLLAIAGLWRDSAEWGASCSMVTTDASAAVRPVHSRMPVILGPADWQAWLGAPPAEAQALCQPYTGSLVVTHSDEPWAGRR